MSSTPAAQVATAPKGQSLWHDALRRLLADKVAVLSFVMIVVYLLVALGAGAGWIASDWQTELGPSRAAPDLTKGWRWWLGLDLFGRSTVLKTIQGAYTAVFVGVMASVVALPIGITLGALAGYFGGWVDEVITWLTTVISNIPEILLLVALTFALGKGMMVVSIALGMTTWVGVARLIRGEFMKHKNREYVVAAAALGAGHGRRIFRHILPNVMHVIIISFSLRFVTAVKSEVVLTYLGLGAPSGTASWGLMINDAKGELTQGIWWGLTGATLGMFFVCLAFSLFADALRDAVDPKLKTGD